MNTFRELWFKLKGSKEYREELVASQLKRGIPFQIRSMMKDRGWSQQDLAQSAKVSQGVVSRAANPNYGNLTINTIIRVAAGFDVAFVGKFVPFSELDKWFIDLSEQSMYVKNFSEEDESLEKQRFLTSPIELTRNFDAITKPRTISPALSTTNTPAINSNIIHINQAKSFARENCGLGENSECTRLVG